MAACAPVPSGLSSFLQLPSAFHNFTFSMIHLLRPMGTQGHGHWHSRGQSGPTHLSHSHLSYTHLSLLLTFAYTSLSLTSFLHISLTHFCIHISLTHIFLTHLSCWMEDQRSAHDHCHVLMVGKKLTMGSFTVEGCGNMYHRGNLHSFLRGLLADFQQDPSHAPRIKACASPGCVRM